jgi:hypothetical protein
MFNTVTASTPQQVCDSLNFTCAAVHRFRGSEEPVVSDAPGSSSDSSDSPDSAVAASTTSGFECKSASDCNQHPCIYGRCVCSGTSLSADCGTLRLLHYEWAHVVPKAEKTAEELAGGPSLKSFRKLLRGMVPLEAARKVIGFFIEVQEPNQVRVGGLVRRQCNTTCWMWSNAVAGADAFTPTQKALRDSKKQKHILTASQSDAHTTRRQTDRQGNRATARRTTHDRHTHTHSVQCCTPCAV